MVEASNALLSSINRSGENSYYYAHAPRQIDNLENAIVIEGEGIVTGGIPRLIHSNSAPQLEIKIHNIRNYSWADEDDEVTIYITLNEQVNPDRVECHFDTRALEVSYNKSEIEIHKLRIPKLNEAINVEQSKFRVRRNRITVVLKKSTSAAWSKLAQ